MFDIIHEDICGFLTPTTPGESMHLDEDDWPDIGYDKPEESLDFKSIAPLEEEEWEDICTVINASRVDQEGQRDTWGAHVSEVNEETKIRAEEETVRLVGGTPREVFLRIKARQLQARNPNFTPSSRSPSPQPASYKSRSPSPEPFSLATPTEIAKAIRRYEQLNDEEKKKLEEEAVAAHQSYADDPWWQSIGMDNKQKRGGKDSYEVPGCILSSVSKYTLPLRLTAYITTVPKPESQNHFVKRIAKEKLEREVAEKKGKEEKKKQKRIQAAEEKLERAKNGEDSEEDGEQESGSGGGKASGDGKGKGKKKDSKLGKALKVPSIVLKPIKGKGKKKDLEEDEGEEEDEEGEESELDENEEFKVDKDIDTAMGAIFRSPESYEAFKNNQSIRATQLIKTNGFDFSAKKVIRRVYRLTRIWTGLENLMEGDGFDDKAHRFIRGIESPKLSARACYNFYMTDVYDIINACLTKIPAANRPFVINSDQGIVEKATTAGKKRKVSARDEGANGEDGDLDDGPVGKKARGKKAIEEEKAQKVEEREEKRMKLQEKQLESIGGMSSAVSTHFNSQATLLQQQAQVEAEKAAHGRKMDVYNANMKRAEVMMNSPNAQLQAAGVELMLSLSLSPT